MLDIKLIRNDPDLVKEGVQKKGFDPSIVDKISEVDKRRREIMAELESLQAEQNSKSKGGPREPAELEELKQLKEKIKVLDQELKNVTEQFDDLKYQLPNLPDKEVPIGEGEGDNVVHREVGEKRDFDFKPLEYTDLGEDLDIIDTVRAAKVSGSRFGYLKGGAALLEFALINFVTEKLTDRKFISKVIKNLKLDVKDDPFVPVVPPVMIKPEIFRGMGRLDQGQEEERYYLPKDELYLIGSAEHTLGPMHTDEILEKDNLPIRYLGFSTSFRREAGSYGKDVKGILRVHQFDKLEMFCFADQELSDKEHRLMVGIQEALTQGLDLPYRLMYICTGDMGWPDSKQFDVETWMPGQNTYRETHSASNTTDFQARRLNVRYKEGKDKKFVHMLNATAFAIGRTLIAIMENYQTRDGHIEIPKALQKHTFGIKEI
jgi:seryl-tRNA synthetase